MSIVRDSAPVSIERTMPAPWEVEPTFHDHLYEWMERAPWLAISVAAHGVAFALIAAIPWNLFERPVDTIINATVAQAVEEEFVDPPPEIEEEIEEHELIEEPIPLDLQEEISEVPVEEFAEEPEGDPLFKDDAPFEAMGHNALIGIGGNAGGKYGNRWGGRGKRGGGGKPASHQNVLAGLQWLADHQNEDGSWDVDGFMQQADCGCEDPGNASQDVGVTGLALLAFLGDGHTTRDGRYKVVVNKAVRWLRQQQDFETGLFGEELGHTFLYDHGIATLAMCEAFYFSSNPMLRGNAQDAINYLSRARNPYGAWRYDAQPTGDNDSSVTGWMVLAMKSAEDGGLKIDREAYTGALNWFDEVTDLSNGRVGYDSMGSVSSRVTGVNDNFPPERGEAMTSVGLLSRFFLGQEPKTHPVMKQHADLLLRTLPEWDPEAFGCDMYYWYYGSYAMYQMGGKHWKTWNDAMKPAVIDSQRRDGHHAGSWDPVGPWGHSGGRVYSTALMVLCLEVYYRYGRLVTGR